MSYHNTTDDIMYLANEIHPWDFFNNTIHYHYKGDRIISYRNVKQISQWNDQCYEIYQSFIGLEFIRTSDTYGTPCPIEGIFKSDISIKSLILKDINISESINFISDYMQAKLHPIHELNLIYGDVDDDAIQAMQLLSREPFELNHINDIHTEKDNMISMYGSFLSAEVDFEYIL